MDRFERRERHAQRDAVARALPDSGEGSLLRKADGQVLVYEEDAAKRHPVTLRAVVMPDGETFEVQTRRFARD